MANIKNWSQPEPTTKEIYDGIYPVAVIASRLTEKPVEKDNIKFIRQTVSLTFRTLQDIPIPNQSTAERIVVEQQYHFDVPMHVNALNGVARAAGVPEFTDTDDFEGKTLIIGMCNHRYTNNNQEEKVIAQMGTGLFTYAPLTAAAEVEFLAKDYPDGCTEDQQKEWFKKKVSQYKSPK